MIRTFFTAQHWSNILKVFSRGGLYFYVVCIAVTCTDPSRASSGLGNDIIYSIVIDRFWSGNKDNDVPRFAFPSDTAYDRSNKYWLYKMHYKNTSSDKAGVSINAYWGGDLEGVIEKMDYLHELGVTVILLSPIFENVNGFHYGHGGTAYHGYWTKDFMRLEEHFVNPPKPGETLDDVLTHGVLLKGLMQKARTYDPPLKIVLDVALNHTSPAPIETTVLDDTNYLEMGVLFKDGQFVSRPCSLENGKSCRETFTGEGWFHRPEGWVEWDNPATIYSGYINGNLADLDQRNPQVKAYLIEALRKWMSFGIDGFRFDAVKTIYPEYLADLEEQLENEYPGIILIGEYFNGGIFENGLAPGETPPSTQWLDGMSYTTMFNFSFATAVREYFTGRMDNLGTPYVIGHILDSNSPHNTLKSRSNRLVNFINNHDIPRMLSMNNASPGGYEAALKLLFVAPGVPNLLYGDEIGLAYQATDKHWLRHDKNDPAWSRLNMAWDNLDDPASANLFKLTRSLVHMRKENYFLKDGSIKFHSATNVNNLFDKSSYMAIQRSRNEAASGNTIIFLYSTRARDRLEFDVNLADGIYNGLHSAKTIQIKDGRLLWLNVTAGESIIINSQTANIGHGKSQ